MEGVVYFIRNDLSYDVKSFVPLEIEYIFFKLLLSNTKTIVALIIYRPVSELDFLEIINTYFSKLDIDNNEIWIHGDSNINLYLNNLYLKVFQKTNLL